MKMTITTLTYESIERNDYSDVLKITIDGEPVVLLHEPSITVAELIYHIEDLMERAFLAGKEGVQFTVEHITVPMDSMVTPS